MGGGGLNGAFRTRIIYFVPPPPFGNETKIVENSSSPTAERTKMFANAELFCANAWEGGGGGGVEEI